MLFTWNRDSFFFFLNIEANARQNRFIKTLLSLFFYFSVLQSLFVENAFFQTIINLNHIKSVFSAIAKFIKKTKTKKSPTILWDLWFKMFHGRYASFSAQFINDCLHGIWFFWKIQNFPSRCYHIPNKWWIFEWLKHHTFSHTIQYSRQS